MSKTEISFEVTPEKDAAIQAGFDTLLNECDFLVELTDEEILHLPKMGRKDLDFVHRSLHHVQTSPQYIPPFVDAAEFVRDVNLADWIRRFQKKVDQFASRLKDTAALAESEAYLSGRLYYNTVKSAIKAGDENAQLVTKDLANHFKSKVSKKTTDDPASGETEQPETENPTT